MIRLLLNAYVTYVDTISNINEISVDRLDGLYDYRRVLRWTRVSLCASATHSVQLTAHVRKAPACLRDLRASASGYSLMAPRPIASLQTLVSGGNVSGFSDSETPPR